MTSKFIVTGKVHGVGYRAFAQRLGLTHDLEGEVWNTRDGSVEMVVSGCPESIDQFAAKLAFGPGRVERVMRQEYAGPVPQGFEIGDTR